MRFEPFSWHILRVATEAGDGRAAAYIAGRLTDTLQIIVRISGELGDLARSTTFNITSVSNVAVLSGHPAFARLQATLLRALAPYAEARAAVVEALRGLARASKNILCPKSSI
jgi:hypothetical protein